MKASGPKPSKPNAKAGAAAKAALKGVSCPPSPSLTDPLKLLISLFLGAFTESAQNPKNDHISPTKNPQTLTNAEVPAKISAARAPT